MKIKIFNIKLQLKPIIIGSVKRIDGTVLKVYYEVNEIIKPPMYIQIETKKDGSEIFYEPNWQFSDTNLKKLINTTVSWEKAYEEQHKKYDKHSNDPEREDDNINIPSWA